MAVEAKVIDLEARRVQVISDDTNAANISISDDLRNIGLDDLADEWEDKPLDADGNLVMEFTGDDAIELLEEIAGKYGDTYESVVDQIAKLHAGGDPKPGQE